MSALPLIRPIALGLALFALVAGPTLRAPTTLAAQSGGPEITLSPGDILKVTIWREEDLSGEFTVDRDGQVVLPMLGTERVIGIPVEILRDTLLAQYRVQLRNPSIEIVPLRRINVLGEVQKPGLYNVDPTISLAGAIAMAGGATPSGDLGRIRIIRDGRIVQQRVGAGESLASVDVQSGDQIILRPRGWIERNSTFLISVALSVPSVIAGILALSR